MTEVIEARDSSPIDAEIEGVDPAWLQRVSQENPDPLVIPLSRKRREAVEEPIVWCNPTGEWWTGRYVGSVVFEGRELRILPRFGFEALEDWLAEVLNVLVTPSVGEQRPSASFLLRLLAAVWGSALVEAARHGVPALRQLRQHAGPTVRGRLDTALTEGRFAVGMPDLVSTERARTLDNPIGRTIVLAHHALRAPLLREGIPEEAWLPQRGRELLPPIRGACGPRPVLPDRRALDRIRYTPITANYRSFVRLSYQIARRRGWLASPSGTGQTYGVLLDVAELWELFVVKCAQRAAAGTGLHIVHGTAAPSVWAVARNEEGITLAQIIPDALVSDRDRYSLVVDAKYKSLAPTSARPRGFDRGDLYQMIAYMERFDCDGVLVYPDQQPVGPAAADGPWKLASALTLSFFPLPVQRGPAREAWGHYLGRMTLDQQDGFLERREPLRQDLSPVR